MIAYITTRYPAISHTFIAREVEALRRLGIPVATMSVHRAVAAPYMSPADREALQTTHALLPARWGEVARAHLRAVICHPRAFAHTLRLSLRLARPGARGRLWQLFYFGEAITSWNHWRTAGVRHVHAHFVAVPSDVALLATTFGRAAGAGPATWSFTVHSLIELRDVGERRLAEKIRLADAVVCVSDYTRSQLMAMVQERHWHKLHVIRCGLELARYEPAGPPPAGVRPQILCVARLVPQKGLALLLRALAILTSRGVEPELELVGDGPCRPELEQLAGQLGVRDRVRFFGPGSQDQIRAAYGAATVFCLPSLIEGLPVVLMEAMACERPVIATAVAGVRELVRDGDTGLLVSAGRADELADALQRLLSDAALRDRLAAQGRMFVERHHDVDASARAVARIFSDVLGEPLAHGAEHWAQAPAEQLAVRA